MAVFSDVCIAVLGKVKLLGIRVCTYLFSPFMFLNLYCVFIRVKLKMRTLLVTMVVDGFGNCLLTPVRCGLCAERL